MNHKDEYTELVNETKELKRNLIASEQRDLRQLMDTCKAIISVSNVFFSELSENKKQKDTFAKLESSPWLWSVFLFGALLATFDYRLLGYVLMFFAGSMLISAYVGGLLVNQKINVIGRDLLEQRYRWISVGNSEESFFQYARLLRTANERASDVDYLPEREETTWWLMVERRMIEKAKG